MKNRKKDLDPSQRPVTLRDVAQAANVSTAAVSRVLHGGGKTVRVSLARAEHIKSVAAEMNYRVNAVARNLRTSRTHTIGVLFENLDGFSSGPLYITYLMDGICRVLFENRYRLTLLSEIDHRALQGSLGDGQLEGVIWCKLARDEETLRLLEQNPIPIVAFNAAPPQEGTGAVYVNCDNRGGIDLAVDHLWELGHRQIAFLHESEERDTPDCVARRDAYRHALAARGGSPAILEWEWNMVGVADPILQMGCTAVVCWTESLAGRLLGDVRRAGIAVPDRLSIIGFDSTQYCETTTPKLTAVNQPIREMASHATKALLALIAGQKPDPFSKVFGCTLDIRGSTGPLGTGA